MSVAFQCLTVCGKLVQYRLTWIKVSSADAGIVQNYSPTRREAEGACWLVFIRYCHALELLGVDNVVSDMPFICTAGQSCLTQWKS